MALKMDEPKNALLSLRIRPSIKTLLEMIAQAEERSLAQTVERLIVAEAERRGLVKPNK